jgi:hypothetical protein
MASVTALCRIPDDAEDTHLLHELPWELGAFPVAADDREHLGVDERPQHLERSDVALQVPDQLRLAHLGSGPADDEGLRPLAPLLVRAACADGDPDAAPALDPAALQHIPVA